MAAASAPITPERFAAALPDLTLGSLHAKAAEIHNSIARLRSSNAQLAPYAFPELDSSEDGEAFDPDYAAAIRENEEVISRMRVRLELLKHEVEGRGAIWVWGSLDDMAAGRTETHPSSDNRNEILSESSTGRSDHSSLGTNGGFSDTSVASLDSQTSQETVPDLQAGSSGVNRPQTGGRLTDEELQERIRQQMAEMEDDEDGGMHL